MGKPEHVQWWGVCSTASEIVQSSPQSNSGLLDDPEMLLPKNENLYTQRLVLKCTKQQKCVTFKRQKQSQMWWHTDVLSELGKWSQEDQKFKVVFCTQQVAGYMRPASFFKKHIDKTKKMETSWISISRQMDELQNTGWPEKMVPALTAWLHLLYKRPEFRSQSCIKWLNHPDPALWGSNCPWPPRVPTCVYIHTHYT